MVGAMFPTVLLMAAVITTMVLTILAVVAIVSYRAERNEGGSSLCARRRARRATLR